MNPDAVRSASDQYVRHPREIAAAITLPAACAALVAPGPAAVTTATAAAITTACGALATRMALVRELADPAVPVARAVRPYDPFHDDTPTALHGVGPTPDLVRVRTAGDRCVAVWQAWKRQGSPRDERIGVAGALALAAWCAWATGSTARAEVRARYALETDPRDPLAGLVLRSVLAGAAPAWRG
ncbi:hypothetical protein DEJ13_10205 [Curtobacterium sp. MCLR17_007]|uniref:hypothetical protein n=1 Tax=Curtobacterium sp. MCLR17_007 TaxID=2175648 RepID=UPI000DA832BB|nr:hypothetical protein [Curtobacterium sp. MCLR17_007]WIB58843.1 hypothetical protein DEJ13_10205 [Curtobacterium sp. MCLR17_007]